MLPPRRSDLLGVQALRAVAALLVVAFHAVEQWTTHRPGYGAGEYWPNGSAGVDIFFVISGLVMTISVQRHVGLPSPARHFIRDRLVRIVPLYWLMTTVKIATVIAVPALSMRTRLDPLYVAGSYALLPLYDNGVLVPPVLPVGWTLIYEMFFYSLVAAALSLRLPLLRVCPPLLGGVALYAVAVPADGFANTIVLEFLFGIAIGCSIKRLQTIPAWIALAAGGIAGAILLVIPGGGALFRPLSWGIPAGCIVAAVVAAEMSLRRCLPRWLLAAGNASYATYLTHGFIVPAVFLVCSRSIPFDAANMSMMLILSLLASAAAGQFTHSLIEQPILLRMRTIMTVSTLPAPG